MTAAACDVLIIGAGQAGGALSKHLSDGGIRVTCLEQGGWVLPAQYPHFSDEWEIEKRREWGFDPNMRDLSADYPVTGAATTMMYAGVGGSTLHYLGAWPRYKPVDFRKGTEHGLGSTIDWPISYEELAPFYDIHDADVGIAGCAGDPANPPTPERYGPPIKPGKLGLIAADALDRLGWQWWPCDNSVLTRPRDGRLECNYCASCIGCPRGSIGSSDYTYWRDAVSNGVDLRTHARVEEITMGPGGRADGAVYVDVRTGAREQVRASIVIVCANGIGSPRLLLMSRPKGHPNGLCNSYDLVGRHLMHHVYGFVDVWLGQATEGYKGTFAPTIFSSEFYETDLSRGFVNGYMICVVRQPGPAVTAAGSATGVYVPWGEDHHDTFRDRFARHLLLAVQGEDLALAANRVTLDPQATDSSGLPAPHVDYQLCENDIRIAEHGVSRCLEVAEALGAVGTDTLVPAYPPPGWHLLGTTRMGHGPEDSVTNKWHQTWEVPNLFCVDGGSLATSAGANPTSTIGALAVRCATYIKRHHRTILEQARTPSNAAAPTI